MNAPAAVLTPPVGPEDHAQFSPDSRWTLVEFGDFQCPYCRGAAAAVKEVQRALGHDLRFVFRHLPLVEIHPRALPAALAAEAAANQGRFWEMHELLYSHQDDLGSRALVGYAEQIGLDMGRFEVDLAADETRSRIARDVESAQRSGVGGTPTFFIGGHIYTGEYDPVTLAAAIQES